MNKELKKIERIISNIEKAAPEVKQRYVDGLAAAKSAKAAAIEARENAETESALERALDAESRADAKQKFFEKKLEELMFTPRLSDQEYDAAIEIAKKVMDEAAADYRAVMVRCVDDLVSAKEKYIEAAKETDAILEELDQTSNFLQSKHRYREVKRQNASSQFFEAPGEWKLHTVRFLSGTGRVHDMVVRNPREHAAYTLPEKSTDYWKLPEY